MTPYDNGWRQNIINLNQLIVLRLTTQYMQQVKHQHRLETMHRPLAASH